MNNQDSKMSFNQQDKKVLHVQEKESIQNTVITPEKESPKDLPDAIILEKEDHDDMDTILSYVVENNLPDKFVVLLKSQLQNCKKDLEIHQRRWDPKIISLYLTLYIRSPQAYEDIKNSTFLQLPSKRLLQY